MAGDKVLVLCATGKIGRNATTALKEAGFDVYGTTRTANRKLVSRGITPVMCNYTERGDLDRAFKETGAKKVFVITDYFLAAKGTAMSKFSKGLPRLRLLKLLVSTT